MGGGYFFLSTAALFWIIYHKLHIIGQPNVVTGHRCILQQPTFAEKSHIAFNFLAVELGNFSSVTAGLIGSETETGLHHEALMNTFKITTPGLTVEIFPRRFHPSKVGYI